MDMDTVEVLKKARELIADEQNWTQGAYARPYHGDNDSTANLSEAKCFCAVGAIHKVGDFDLALSVPRDIIIPIVTDDAFIEYGDLLYEGKIIEFNDNHTHAEVLALFDRAIARAEGGAA